MTASHSLQVERITSNRADAVFPLAEETVVKTTTPIGVDFKGSRTDQYWTRKKAIVTHFNALFRFGLVQWPKRSDVAQRYRLRIPKFDLSALGND